MTGVMCAIIGASSAAGIEYVGGYAEGFAGTTSNKTITLTSLAGGLASAPAAGDFVIVYFGTASASNRDLVVSGYTEIDELYSNDSNDTNLVVAYKFMGATPDTGFTITGGTLSSLDAGAVAVQVWRRVNATTPLDVSAKTVVDINTVMPEFESILPVTSGAVIVAGAAGAHTRLGSTYSSSDLTQFNSAGANDSYDATVGLGYRVWTSGSFTPNTLTFSSTDSTTFSSASCILALRPAQNQWTTYGTDMSAL